MAKTLLRILCSFLRAPMFLRNFDICLCTKILSQNFRTSQFKSLALNIVFEIYHNVKNF